jgi:hypothetical protein
MAHLTIGNLQPADYMRITYEAGAVFMQSLPAIIKTALNSAMVPWLVRVITACAAPSAYVQSFYNLTAQCASS